MLSGRRAFARDSSIETMRAILKEDPAELSGVKGSVPSGLEQIVRRCLEKRPDERFQSARDVAFALEAVSGSRAGMGFESSPRPVRRRLVVGAGSPHCRSTRSVDRLASGLPLRPGRESRAPGRSRRISWRKPGR